jgi:DNA-binding FadR family transcriptional regulator
MIMTSKTSQTKPELRQSESAEMLGLLQRISGTSPVDVMAARLMVEPHAAAAAAVNATTADLASIRENLMPNFMCASSRRHAMNCCSACMTFYASSATSQLGLR